jgi:hypothetical protein
LHDDERDFYHVTAELKLFPERFPSEERNIPRIDPVWANRWILRRVFELGWTVERFKDFDEQNPGLDRKRPQVERFGKKYQRIVLIVLHELLGGGQTTMDVHGRDRDPRPVETFTLG